MCNVNNEKCDVILLAVSEVVYFTCVWRTIDWRYKQHTLACHNWIFASYVKKNRNKKFNVMYEKDTVEKGVILKAENVYGISNLLFYQDV